MTTRKVHTYHSSPKGFAVNTHLIETPAGLIAIDTQFLLSEAVQAKALITQLKKPLLGIVITHPHPDHFNGTGVLVEGTDQVPIFATQATLDGIREIEAPKRNQWQQVYGADYPTSTTLPTHIVKSGERITLDGVTLTLEDIGVGESPNQTLVHWASERILFAGDLAYHKVHPWLAEGHSLDWLTQLAQVQQRYSETRTVYVGHGKENSLLGLNEQVDYLNLLHTLIRQHCDGDGILTEQGTADVKSAMLARYPGYPLEMLLDSAIDAVAAELRAPKRQR